MDHTGRVALAVESTVTGDGFQVALTPRDLRAFLCDMFLYLDTIDSEASS
jgi:hypothetical protein